MSCIRYLTLLSVIRTCSNFWYTTWAWVARWCALAATAIVVRMKMLVCSVHSAAIADQYLHGKNKITMMKPDKTESQLLIVN